MNLFSPLIKELKGKKIAVTNSQPRFIESGKTHATLRTGYSKGQLSRARFPIL